MKSPAIEIAALAKRNQQAHGLLIPSGHAMIKSTNTNLRGIHVLYFGGGMPAGGKSTPALKISRDPNIPMLSKDSIKERMFDDIGFHSRDEKVKPGNAAMHIMCYAAEQLMKCSMPFVLENNLEDASRPEIMEL